MGSHLSTTLYMKHYSEHYQSTMPVLHDREQAALDPETHDLQCLLQDLPAVFA